jgi:hypothetical protein
MNVFGRLVSLFTNENARFQIIEHTPEGRSDLVAAVRGTSIAQGANPDHSSRLAFLPAGSAHARRRSVRLDRCASTRCATHWGLICLVGGSSGARSPVAQGPDGIRPSATARNSAPSGQLVGS